MSSAFLGADGNRALFNVNGRGVVVNTRSLTASVVPLDETEMSTFWLAAPEADQAKVRGWGDVAAVEESSIAEQADVIVAAAGLDTRMFTVPKRAREAARAVPRTQHSVGLSALVARGALVNASNSQVSLQTISLLNRYFTSSVEDRGTPRWEAYGGDAASRWSAVTLAKMPLTAAIDPEINMLAFYEGDDDERAFFGVRQHDGTFSELLKQDRAVGWQLWFNGDWVRTPIPVNERELGLVELDDDSAVYLAASLFDTPGLPVDVSGLDPEEFSIAAAALPTLDTVILDRVMTAAGQGYTEEERSKNASRQLRDANGKFAQVGDTGVIKASGTSGTVTTVNPVDNTIIVEGDDGNTYAIRPDEFEVGGSPSTLQSGPVESKLPPLNLDSILGQPRATKTSPKAFLKHLLPPMNPARLKQVVGDYESLIARERQRYSSRFKGGTGWRESRPPTKDERARTRELEDDLSEYERRQRRESGPKGPGASPTKFALEEGDPPPVEKLDPETSDVKPLYLAIVDRDDPQAVTDLVAMIPATTGSNETTTYRRVGGAWVEDAKMLRDIKSPTPPPVVQLDDETYQDVLQQVDDSTPDDESASPPGAQSPDDAQGAQPSQPAAVTADAGSSSILLWGPNGQLAALVAAGGADRNRGNAERLRRYWLYGPGAAKIRWGTGGDWKRCVRQLSKHLGTRAKGYCALRHKEATGMWTGDRRHRQLYGSIPYTKQHDTTQVIRMRQAVLTASADAARVRSMKARVYGIDSDLHTEPEQIPVEGGGRRFRIPLLIPEGVESGDGRTFDVGSLSMRSFPLPLMWQEKTGDGHDGSYLVGRIDRVERIQGGLGNAVGVFDTGPWGQEAQRLVENKMLRWVSADLDRFEADEIELADDAGEPTGQTKLKIKKGRLMGATLVSKPAFQECTIELVYDGDVVPINDGAYVSGPDETDAQAIVAAGSIAMSIPVVPPASWFENPQLGGPTPLTTDETGRVFGHVASWEVDHIGLPGGTRAPRSQSNYAYFHSGVVRADDGKDKTVGQLTLAGGHADLRADAAMAVRHYDDTGSAVADVHAGEDAYGIWVAGALRPGTTPEQIRALRASAPSGDWRVINNRLEMVAVCQVNVPGFPITRAQVASGAVMALVAAGSATLARMKSDPVAELQARMTRMEEFERRQETARAAAARQTLETALGHRNARRVEQENIAAAARARVFKALDVDGYMREFKTFSAEKLAELTASRKALPDGSFPIENTADLRRAIAAYGTLSEADQTARTRRHIVRQAYALDRLATVPKDWPERGLNELALSARDHRETLTAAAQQRKVDDLRRRVRGN